ncbi:MAG: response regulator [Acidimicrobiales bacterium]
MKTVLIVDDEPDIRALVALCLDHLRVEVLQAAGLTGALNIARANDVGLVLLDLALGSEDGLEILPELRREPRLSGAPVVAFSAHDSRRREALDHGMDSFLKRPFTSAELRSTVELYLGTPTDGE